MTYIHHVYLFFNTNLFPFPAQIVSVDEGLDRCAAMLKSLIDVEEKNSHSMIQ